MNQPGMGRTQASCLCADELLCLRTNLFVPMFRPFVYTVGTRRATSSFPMEWHFTFFFFQNTMTCVTTPCSLGIVSWWYFGNMQIPRLDNACNWHLSVRLFLCLAMLLSFAMNGAKHFTSQQVSRVSSKTPRALYTFMFLPCLFFFLAREREREWERDLVITFTYVGVVRWMWWLDWYHVHEREWVVLGTCDEMSGTEVHVSESADVPVR
jgi:hypothetical protein